ncbi:uncharacterized protein LOC119381880 [Rhipicephalus sanguineus]|uniref:uncharacterized protein LOC119381880 n=1 Tax=Rhipicephalus sanguineus TaxID=34632 RepID=UPI0018932D8E|nr:uncharacterized protein LOC119381880 [Rhipicephalus sanguineus]
MTQTELDNFNFSIRRHTPDESTQMKSIGKKGRTFGRTHRKGCRARNTRCTSFATLQQPRLQIASPLLSSGNFNGTHLRVSALNWPPWITLNCADEDPRDAMYGPMANMIEVLSDGGGFTYDVTCAQGGGTGIVFPNGSWTGVIGDLQRNCAIE